MDVSFDKIALVTRWTHIRWRSQVRRVVDVAQL